MKHGEVVIPGTPPVREVRQVDRGGIWDTLQEEWVGPSRNPVVWFASEIQAKLALHEVDEEKILAYGAMGSGKTEGAMSTWALFRAFELAGTWLEGGLTAPTTKRTGAILKALLKRAPRDWFTFHARDAIFRLRLGFEYRLITTTEASKEAGSPIQAWNWAVH